jgi:putative ABC transport system substrate-binding protein
MEMKRREFLGVLGGAAVAWPAAVRAQQSAMPVIGYLDPGVPDGRPHLAAAFRKGLSEAGYVEGRNVAIEYRWGQDDNKRMPELAAELVHRKVAVIVTLQNLPGALAAKAATTTIPIVFSTGSDPVQSGLVASLNRPGGNVTGVTNMGGGILLQKRMGLLVELLPSATRFAMLVNPSNPSSESQIKEIQSAAAAIGRQVEILAAHTNREIDSAFAGLVQKRTDAVQVSADPFFTNRRVQIVTLAAHHRVPVIYPNREYAAAGGLMSYGSNLADVYQLTGVYAGRILKGEQPANLPVIRTTKFEFVVNLQMARTLGIEIPSTLLARADEVIE